MCYTVGQDKTIDKVNRGTNKQVKLSARKKAESVPSAYFVSAFNFPLLPVITQEEPGEIDVMRWGLVPPFIKTQKEAREFALNTFNAKSETIFEKVSFKKSILTSRCIVPTTGFYEWRSEGDFKYPYFIKTKDQDLTYLGGIYSLWEDSVSGETEGTFSIVTTEANPLMTKIHNVKKRMPLILKNDNMNEWIAGGLTDSDIKQLMIPFNENEMQAHTIRRISPKDVDPFSPKIIEEFEYPEFAFYE